MNNKFVDQDSYRSFQLMTEIESGESVTQRELAGRLGVAVGLVNSYLKNFVAKGYVRIKTFPRNRYGYLLTPKGFTEKSRLAYQHLSYFNNLYTVVRSDYLDLFRKLSDNGIQIVSFCGADEVTEIAYLSLKETELKLSVVMDYEGVGSCLFGKPVIDLVACEEALRHPVIITSIKRGAALKLKLLGVGIDGSDIYYLGVK